MWALMKMQAGEGNVELVQTNEPSPNADEVKIKVNSTGICGTDIKIWKGTAWSNPPVILGHEFSGTITEIGADVKGLAPGDRVVAETAQVICHNCEYCNTGNYLMCDQRLSIGYGVNGAFTDYCVARQGIIHKIPDNVSFEQAALCEPCAVAVHAVFDSAEVLPSQLAIVTGPGPIGLLVAQAAKSRGAAVCMLGTDADEKRLILAKELGIDYTFNIQKCDPAKEIGKITRQGMADFVYECSGAAPAVQMGMKLLKKRGKLVQVGLTKPSFEIEYSLLAAKEISLIGTFGHKWTNWDMALKLMSSGQIRVDKMITHTFPLSDWEKGFRAAEALEGIKILLCP